MTILAPLIFFIWVMSTHGLGNVKEIEVEGGNIGKGEGGRREIVVEYARDRPFVYSNGYHLVSHWTGQDPRFNSEGSDRTLLDIPEIHSLGPVKKRRQKKKAIKSVGGDFDVKMNHKSSGEFRNEWKNGEKRFRKRSRKIPRRIKSGRGEQWERHLSGQGIFRDFSYCLEIPRNMSLCSNIEYNFMRVPNLLHHSSISEIVTKSSDWTGLLRMKCHRDAQIFLCSVFAPVCLEKPIYPCRRTCEAVRDGCAAPMRRYNFEWPENLDCSRFPADTDLCVGLREEEHLERSEAVPRDQRGGNPYNRHGGACNLCGVGLDQASFVDHYCEADIVMKAYLFGVRRVYRYRWTFGVNKKGLEWIKGSRRLEERVRKGKESFILRTNNCDCGQVVRELNKLRDYRRFKGIEKKLTTTAEGLNGKSQKNGSQLENNLSLSTSPLPTLSSFSAFQKSSSVFPRRPLNRYLIMTKKFANRHSVILIKNLANRAPLVRQALRTIESNHLGICSSIS